MKIVGLTYYAGKESVVLKSDSSLLTNRKPLFVPEGCGELCALPCWVLRVSRLGRSIAPKFATRYYDAVAAGLDFFSADKLRQAQAEGMAWTEAIAFEGSLAVGTWEQVESEKWKVKTERADCPLAPKDEPKSEPHHWLLERNGVTTQEYAWDSIGLADTFSQAIARISNMVTIRQGDLLYIAHPYARWTLQAEDKLQSMYNGEETLFCRIK